MKIAIIGIKGIPVIYSGFETFAEELSTRLVKDKDYNVTVYCRSAYINKNRKHYRGVKVITLPTIRRKSLETIFHSFISTLHACFLRRYDVIYYIGVGNAAFTLLPRIMGIKTVINVDGFDWKREKWGSLGKSYLKLSSYISMFFPNAVITDSLLIKKYYTQKRKKKYYYIPYGYMDNFSKNSTRVLNKYNLKKNKYIVWVGRIVPENHTEDLLLAFSKLKTNFKCVVIGDNFYEDEYTKKIFGFARQNSKIIFTGFLNREEYAALVKKAFMYVETKRSGGTHPSLLEAMGFGSLIVSNNNSTNRKLLKLNAFYYNTDRDLCKTLKYILSSNFKNNSSYRQQVRDTAERFFNWNEIIKQYKSLFMSLYALDD